MFGDSQHKVQHAAPKGTFSPTKHQVQNKQRFQQRHCFITWHSSDLHPKIWLMMCFHSKSFYFKFDSPEFIKQINVLSQWKNMFVKKFLLILFNLIFVC